MMRQWRGRHTDARSRVIGRTSGFDCSACGPAHRDCYVASDTCALQMYAACAHKEWCQVLLSGNLSVGVRLGLGLHARSSGCTLSVVSVSVTASKVRIA